MTFGVFVTLHQVVGRECNFQYSRPMSGRAGYSLPVPTAAVVRQARRLGGSARSLRLGEAEVRAVSATGTATYRANRKATREAILRAIWRATVRATARATRTATQTAMVGAASRAADEAIGAATLRATGTAMGKAIRAATV